MKRGLVVFVLVIILLFSVIANSEVSEQISNENSKSQSSPDSSVDIVSPDPGEPSDSSISPDNSNSQIPSSDVSDSNENNNVEDANSNEDNSNGNSENNNEEKITICHKPGTPAEKTLEIPVAALDGHLGHGDYVGECSNEDTDTDEDEPDEVSVNNIPNSGNDNSGDNHHDYVNIPHEPISDNPPIINNPEPEIIDDETPVEEDIQDVPNLITGDVILDFENVIICHKPNSPAEKTMEIPIEALEGHLNHGDYKGFCKNMNFKADAGYDQAVNEKEKVVFYGSSGIPDGLGLSVDYIWDFGDGKITEGINLKNPVHVYDKEGVYYVKLIVKIGDYISEDKLAIDVSDIDN